MKKADEYKRHAQQCRDLAGKMPTQEVREQLLEMARIWERMAEERAQFVSDYPQFEIARG